MNTTNTSALVSLRNLIASLVASQAQTVSLEEGLDRLKQSRCLDRFVRDIIQEDVYSEGFALQIEKHGGLEALAAMRMLRTCLAMSLGQAFQQLATAVQAFSKSEGKAWANLARRVQDSQFASWRTMEFFKQGAFRNAYLALEESLVREQPHALYPTSPFRESSGSTLSNTDYQHVEAVMTSRTFTTVKVVEGVLQPECDVLRDIYKPLGRCVCIIDQNVEQNFGWQLESYFAEHGIELEKLVYRAMEIDKGIRTVEMMLGDFKQLGVSRQEPVLVVGGGVISDTSGLACALYHRGTPYVMLSSSIVAGIDAGPSPRTCCDGFGYKNLFGAYHTPMLSITDRSLFKTLRPGWLRHGIAEIIKMATVKDHELFEDLETAGRELIDTRFGALSEYRDSQVGELSQRILGRAIKSYVEAEYGNLYETHQCRPHAYGHTWSPGFEIPAGLLHGHAVSIGMGFGAFLSCRVGWISQEQCDRVMRLIDSFDLSLWHEVLQDQELVWAAQMKMVEKRGGHLAAPLPKAQIGQCGYLNSLTQKELFAALDDYRRLCREFPRNGKGVEAHCCDVGLEDPSTVGESLG